MAPLVFFDKSTEFHLHPSFLILIIPTLHHNTILTHSSLTMFSSLNYGNRHRHVTNAELVAQIQRESNEIAWIKIEEYKALIIYEVQGVKLWVPFSGLANCQIENFPGQANITVEEHVETDGESKCRWED